jgi:hypothetical protein
LGRASALSLVVNALLVWNTRYLDHAAATLALRGEPIPAHVWSHLSPVLWEHVHLVGNYRFEEPALAGELRPLRFPIQVEAGSDAAIPTLRTVTPKQALQPNLGLE